MSDPIENFKRHTFLFMTSRFIDIQIQIKTHFSHLKNWPFYVTVRLEVRLVYIDGYGETYKVTYNDILIYYRNNLILIKENSIEIER